MNGYQNTVFQALSELVADHMALHIFGPAAFAALAELASLADIDANPLECQNYPPWRYRLRLMGDSIDKDTARMLGVKKREEVTPELVKKKVPPELVELIMWLRDVIASSDEESDMRCINAQTVTREAYVLVDKYMSNLCELVIKQLPPDLQQPYSLSAHKDKVKDLLGKLERSIPPNEFGDWPKAVPAELADILNAGWAFKLSEIARNPDWGANDDAEALFRLVLKAIEASDVHQTYGPKLNKEDPASP